MNSMTGFGRGQVDSNGSRITATAQSWNHRHADLVFRLPDRLRGSEARLKPRVAERIQRGRCEIAVRVEESEKAGRWELDVAGLTALVDQTRDAVASGLVEPRVALGDLLRSPFVTASAPGAELRDGELAPEFEADVVRAIEAALAELAAARAAEGARLETALRSGAATLRRLAGELAARREAVAGELESALRRRLDQILPGGAQSVPAERLAQEIVLLVERSDVEEELERLRGHLVAFDEALGATGAQGRRLDFLVQEIQRELSTLGAKARDLELTRLVIDAKVVNEQLREQIQNVE